ncbi:bacteriohemerythrin [Magnetospira sp. QH-2]|uniref:bacteriohemerythrin n=1 Tax=Magnetospira sp. (strain QH-2) TaxID=1288970 RepID=UPI0003E81057|nr:hemerythrin domain-containing protein [Magnetospira sp. QH-2]CCQ72425.1 putative Hemerythrin-like metal-binding protein [Magnetospira sp. QH-2]
MTMIDWNPDFELGDDLIDSQHRQLLDLANFLIDAVDQHKEEQILKQAFDALLLYTQQHFKDEELLFEQRGCSKLEEHRKQHHVLEGEVRALWREDLLGFVDEMGQTLETWVLNRLIPHMTGEDQEAHVACRYI